MLYSTGTKRKILGEVLQVTFRKFTLEELKLKKEIRIGWDG